MTLLFNRVARVTVATRLSGTTTDKSGARFNKFTQRVVIENLRINFDIVKTTKPDSNKATIRIYNLGPESRALFRQKPTRVTLEAGYGNEYSKVYEGDLMHGYSRREGPEWVTELQLGTGHDAARSARVNRSFKIGAKPQDMIKECAEAMGLSMPHDFQSAKALFSSFQSGVTMQGLASDQLTKILKPSGFGWSNQDGKLQILRKGDTNQAPAIVVSQSTGMVGSPEFAPPVEKGGPPILKVKTLLEPTFTPGGLVQIKSRDVDSSFKILSAHHMGDTHEQPWFSEVEAQHL